MRSARRTKRRFANVFQHHCPLYPLPPRSLDVLDHQQRLKRLLPYRLTIYERLNTTERDGLPLPFMTTYLAHR